MTAQPCTSVIIPVLNGERFILGAVRSVLDQLDVEDEVLVVDDGSTDGTRALLDVPDRRLKLLAGPRSGPSAARNVGLHAARGELIAFLDHDDAWPAGRHAVLRGALVADETVDAAAGRIQILVEPDGAVGGYGHLHGQFGASLPWTCLFRRGIISKAGLFDESLRYGEDVDYYLRLLEAGMKLCHCDHDALVYRRHSGNATNAGPSHAQTSLTLVARKLSRLRGKLLGNS